MLGAVLASSAAGCAVISMSAAHARTRAACFASLLVSYRPLAWIIALLWRDAGIGTGERGRGVSGLLDEVGGETQERRARRGRGRGAVGLGGGRGRRAERAGPVPVSGRHAHEDAAGAGDLTLKINALRIDGSVARAATSAVRPQTASPSLSARARLVVSTLPVSSVASVFILRAVLLAVLK